MLKKKSIGLITIVAISIFLAICACTADKPVEVGLLGGAMVEPAVCPVNEQPAALAGSEITGLKDPRGLVMYPGSVQISYSEPPE